MARLRKHNKTKKKCQKDIRRPVVYIEWEDHFTEACGWNEIKDMITPEKEEFHCISLGWIIHEDERWLKISPCISGTACNLVVVVLKSCITKRKEIKI